MKKKTFKTKEDFIKAYFITCPVCGYNNERKRNNQYGTCLKCGAILDDKTYFMIRMQELIKNNKQKGR